MATATEPALSARPTQVGSRFGALRALLFAGGMLFGAVIFAIGLSSFYDLGRAEAETASAPVDAIDAGSAVAIEAPPSTTVTTTTTTTAPAAAPVAAAPADGEVDNLTISHQWRSGSLISAGGLALFVVLSFLLKVDRKRAFYYSAGAAAVGMTLDAIVRGDTPTFSMLIAAVTTFVGILVRGPAVTVQPGTEPKS